MSQPKPNGWWAQAIRERDGWASVTKLQRLVAFFVTTLLVCYFAYLGKVPDSISELLAIYLAYAVGARATSKWIENKEKKDV